MGTVATTGTQTPLKVSHQTDTKELDPRKDAKIFYVTDVRAILTNGVSNTQKYTLQKLRDGSLGTRDEVELIDPDHEAFKSAITLNFGYFVKDGKTVLPLLDHLDKLFREGKPDAIFIATPEGTLGGAFREYCRKNGIAFTTAAHNHVPSYFQNQYKKNKSKIAQFLANPLVNTLDHLKKYLNGSTALDETIDLVNFAIDYDKNSAQQNDQMPLLTRFTKQANIFFGQFGDSGNAVKDFLESLGIPLDETQAHDLLKSKLASKKAPIKEFSTEALNKTIEAGISFLEKPEVRNRLYELFKNIASNEIKKNMGNGLLAYFKKLGVDKTLENLRSNPEQIEQLLDTHLGSKIEGFAEEMMKIAHEDSSCVLPPSQTFVEELKDMGINSPIKVWGRGIDLNDFKITPQDQKLELRKKLLKKQLDNLDKEIDLNVPVFLNLGRVSAEKNLDEFYSLDLPGIMIQVGDGSERADLEKKYADKIKEGKLFFVGNKEGEERKNFYSCADFFVFPSKGFDTLGAVQLEALASGLAVIAPNERVQKEILANTKFGFLDNDLQEAANKAILAKKNGEYSAEDCRKHIKENYSWDDTTKTLRANLKQINHGHMEKVMRKEEPPVLKVHKPKLPKNIKRIRSTSFSDIHKSNMRKDLAYDHTKIFARELANLNKTIEKSKKNETMDILVLNGDIYDFLESYAWSHKDLLLTYGGAVKDESKVDALLEELAKTQQNKKNDITTQLQRFLKGKNRQIIYVPGNHDHLMNVYPKARKWFQELCMPGATDAQKNEKVIFAQNVDIDEMEVHYEHGHRIDPYDNSKHGEIALGDWLAWVKVSTIKRIEERLNELKQKDKYEDEQSQNIIDKAIHKIMKVEYIRDASFFPVHLNKTIESSGAKDSDSSKVAKLKNKIRDAIKVYEDDMAEMIKSSPVLSSFRPMLPSFILKSTFFKKLSTFVINYIYRSQTHKNSHQLEEAININNRNPKITSSVMGHTHITGYENSYNPQTKRNVRAITDTSFIPMKKGRITKDGREHISDTSHPIGGIQISANIEPDERGKRKVKIKRPGFGNSYSITR